MPRFPRKHLDTTFFHIMSQGINRSYIFDNPVDIKYYIKNMYKLKDQYKIRIIAYCIMNNHTHMLLECHSIENLSKYMHSLNTRYGQYFNKRYNRLGYVFRDRYKSEGIYTKEQLNNCIHYIYNNPVKAGICERPEQYKFSNYRKISTSYNGKYVFIDIEEDKDVLCKDLIKDFLDDNMLNLKDLKNDNKDKLNELLIILKEKHKISFRTISKHIAINREKLRRLYNQQ